MLQLEVLILELVAVDRLASGAVSSGEVATLTKTQLASSIHDIPNLGYCLNLIEAEAIKILSPHPETYCSTSDLTVTVKQTFTMMLLRSTVITRAEHTWHMKLGMTRWKVDPL